MACQSSFFYLEIFFGEIPLLSSENILTIDTAELCSTITEVAVAIVETRTTVLTWALGTSYSVWRSHRERRSSMIISSSKLLCGVFVWPGITGGVVWPGINGGVVWPGITGGRVWTGFTGGGVWTGGSRKRSNSEHWSGLTHTCSTSWMLTLITGMCWWTLTRHSIIDHNTRTCVTISRKIAAYNIRGCWRCCGGCRS